MRKVAVLYVDPKGCYAGLQGVELWDEARDARRYDEDRERFPRDEGLVLHPPCPTWCQLASVNEKRYGHEIGSDGGCFESALRSVRRWGGVLEHPAHTIAWTHFSIRRPHLSGGWLPTRCGGYVCHVEQGQYGHPARKATWLLVYGLKRTKLPELRWGAGSEPKAWVGWMKNHGEGEGKERVGKKAAAATPVEFRDLLLAIARLTNPCNEEPPTVIRSRPEQTSLW